MCFTEENAGLGSAQRRYTVDVVCTHLSSSHRYAVALLLRDTRRVLFPFMISFCLTRLRKLTVLYRCSYSATALF